MRGKGGAGESMYGNRDDMPTLRVTNLSEDAQEDDLYELFNRFGRMCVGVPATCADGQTPRLCRQGPGDGLVQGVRGDRGGDANSASFAFISFSDRKDAERAMEKVCVGDDRVFCRVVAMAIAFFAIGLKIDPILSPLTPPSNGLPYDHQILSVSWSFVFIRQRRADRRSVPREKRP